MRPNRLILLTIGILVGFIGILNLGRIHFFSGSSLMKSITPYLEKSEQPSSRKYDYLFKYAEHSGDTFAGAIELPVEK